MKAKAIDALAQLEPQASLLRDAGFPEIDNGNNYPALKGVHSSCCGRSRTGTKATRTLAANFLRAWDAITKWIYDPANKAELLAITKKTMGGTDKGAEARLQPARSGKSVPQSLRINEKYMQQFVDNQKKAGVENVPTDAMKYVDSSLVDKVLQVVTKV